MSETAKDAAQKLRDTLELEKLVRAHRADTFRRTMSLIRIGSAFAALLLAVLYRC